eukprot:IDg6364t1
MRPNTSLYHERRMKWMVTHATEPVDWAQARADTLDVDNTAAIAVAQVRARTRKSKYIDVHYHHIRDRIRRREIIMRHRHRRDWLRMRSPKHCARSDLLYIAKPWA